jgi:hypothetical protein
LILTSVLYFNAFLLIPLSFCAGKNFMLSWYHLVFLPKVLHAAGSYVTLIIMLELMSILQFILTSFLYWNSFLVIPLLFFAAKTGFVLMPFGFWHKRYDAYVTLLCIILLELLLILKFILTSLLYQNSFWAKPLLFSLGDNSFCSDAIWFLAQMLFMLTLCCPA